MFEPQEEIFNYLKIKYNKNKDIFLFNKALSTRVMQSLILTNTILHRLYRT